MTSRRLRFEILRRDNYTCRYCGTSAPDVQLQVDHVIPAALGGGDEPRNLITACQPCNAGKSSMPADAELVADVDATALLFARAMDRASATRRTELVDLDKSIAAFDEEWLKYSTGTDSGPVPRENDWKSTISLFVSHGFDVETDLKRFTETAMNADINSGSVWKYFCGCCWRELATRQELARQTIENGDV